MAAVRSVATKSEPLRSLMAASARLFPSRLCSTLHSWLLVPAISTAELTISTPWTSCRPSLRGSLANGYGFRVRSGCRLWSSAAPQPLITETEDSGRARPDRARLKVTMEEHIIEWGSALIGGFRRWVCCPGNPNLREFNFRKAVHFCSRGDIPGNPCCAVRLGNLIRAVGDAVEVPIGMEGSGRSAGSFMPSVLGPSWRKVDWDVSSALWPNEDLQFNWHFLEGSSWYPFLWVVLISLGLLGFRIWDPGAFLDIGIHSCRSCCS